MNKLIIATFIFAAAFHCASATENPLPAQDVVRSYQEERRSVIESSLRTQDPEFKALLLSEQNLLNELGKPGHELQITLLVFHEKLSSINTLKNTIVEARNPPNELSSYFIKRYQADLARPRAEAATLERAIAELTNK